MRRIPGIMAITFFSLLIWDIQVDAQTRTTATSTREDTSGAASTVTRAVKDKGFEAGAIARSIVEEASQLKNDAAEWGQKLQELEADLNNNQNVDDTVKDVERWLVVVRAAADRLAPKSETRANLRKQEDAIRDLAIRAEVHSDQAIRKTAGYFQQKTAELHAVNRSLEETRIRLVTEIDRLEELKGELEFNHAAAQSDESLKDGKVIVDNIQALTGAAQRLATDLQNLGGTVPVAATPGYAAKPVEAAKDLTPPPPSNAPRLLAPGKPFQAAKNLTTTPPSNAPRPLTPGTAQSKPTTLR
jgi:ABC-type transporter Mla subunit MlaD